MSDRPRRLNNLDCAIAFDYGRLLEETRSKKAGYDELLVALDRAFAQSGVDATTRELLHRCAAAVGLVDRPRFSDGATVLEWIRAVVEEAGAEMLALPNGDLRFRPQPDPMQQIRYVIGELGGEFQQLALRNFAEGIARAAPMPRVSEEEISRFRRFGAQVRENEAREPLLSDQVANWRPGFAVAVAAQRFGFATPSRQNRTPGRGQFDPTNGRPGRGPAVRPGRRSPSHLHEVRHDRLRHPDGRLRSSLRRRAFPHRPKHRALFAVRLMGRLQRRQAMQVASVPSVPGVAHATGVGALEHGAQARRGRLRPAAEQ